MQLTGDERLCDVLTDNEIDFIQNYLRVQPDAQRVLRGTAANYFKLFPRNRRGNLFLVEAGKVCVT